MHKGVEEGIDEKIVIREAKISASHLHQATEEGGGHQPGGIGIDQQGDTQPESADRSGGDSAA